MKIDIHKLRSTWLASILFFLPFITSAQTTLAFQSFEGGSDNWSFTQTPAAGVINTSGDLWDITSGTLGGLTTMPTQGTFFFGGVDVANGQNPNGTFGTLDFDNVVTSGFINISISFDYEVDGYDGGDDMDYEVFIDGVGQGSVKLVDGSSNLDAHGTETISIPGTPSSVKLVVTVTQNGTDYFGVDNFVVQGIAEGSNIPPTIANIVATPEFPTSTDTVSIDANATDADGGIDSVILSWSAGTDTLDTTISMNLTSADTYTTATAIPAQADGTQVFYQITATDNEGASTTSEVLQYVVNDPDPPGLQVVSLNDRYTINFDTSIAHVNNGSFNGTGLQESPLLNQLDSDAFRIIGLSDGDTAFGGTHTSGDFARGASDGGVNSGGIYAFEVQPGNVALGFQATGSDFTPGALQLRFQNQTGSTISTLSIAYALYHYNNEGRLGQLGFAHGTEGSSLTQVTDFNLDIDDSDDSNPSWKRNFYVIDIDGIAIPHEGTYILEWQYDSPGGSGSNDEFAIDNIQLIANPNNNTPQISGAYQDMTINGNAEVGSASTLSRKLKLNNGTLFTNDILTFKSTAQGTAQIDQVPFNGTTINGDVTVERFIPGRRAFRLLSSPVNLNGTIRENLQEDAISATDDPHPGFGTHITGSTTDGENGFDATASGNPSLFLFDNQGQQWEAIDDTNSVLTSFSNGEPFRILVRGSRAVDLTSNTATADDTVLRFKGTLLNGTTAFGTTTDANDLGTEFFFVGNPYMAHVDMNTVLNDIATSNVSETFYTIWDPTIAARGAYVTIDVTDGSNSLFVGGGASASAANQYLQAMQSAFVEIVDTSPGRTLGIRFTEEAKAVENSTTTTFGTEINDIEMGIVLYSQESFDFNTPLDGTRIRFSNEYANTNDGKDAGKFFNTDESIARLNDNKYLSIESRSMPVDEELLPLFLHNYKMTAYVMSIQNPVFSNVQAYIVDRYNNTTTLLTEGNNIIPFTVDLNDESSAGDRFAIQFQSEELSIASNDTLSLTVYPNPLKNDDLKIVSNELANKEVTVGVTSVLGQKLAEAKRTFNGQVLIVSLLKSLPSGIYFVTIQDKHRSSTQRVVKN